MVEFCRQYYILEANKSMDKVIKSVKSVLLVVNLLYIRMNRLLVAIPLKEIAVVGE